MKAAKALKEKGETPEELLRSIKENEAAVAEAQRTVDAWKAIAGERKRRAEEAERVVQEKAEEEARVEAEKKAEAERKAEEEQRAAEEKRIAEEKAEAERKAQEERERAEEERDRIEAELDAQKADEEARLEAERKAEEEAVEKDAELKEDKKKPQIKDVVKTIYEKGKAVASKLFGRSIIDVAKTPDFMKKLGLTGDRFTIKYGVLSRHAGKDASHLLTEKQWEELPDAIQKPFAITRFGEKENGYRLYTTMKNDKGETIVVGVDVKNIGRNLEVNSISTIFGRRGDAKITQKEEVLYTDEKITPEQRSLLGQPNSDQYTDTRERNVSADKGSEKPEKKQEKQSVFDKAKEIADKEEKKRKAEADKPKQKPLTEAERKDAEAVADKEKKTEKNQSGNKLVTDERYEELKKRMKAKLGQLNAGVDPEMLSIGTEMAVYHIEKGARAFADYAKSMIADLGDAIRPYLKAFYNGARDLPEVEEAGLSEEMTPYDEVRSFDTANFDKENNETKENNREQSKSKPNADRVAADNPQSWVGRTFTTNTGAELVCKDVDGKYATFFNKNTFMNVGFEVATVQDYLKRGVLDMEETASEWKNESVTEKAAEIDNEEK